MTNISEKLIDHMWQSVGSKRAEQVLAMQKRHQKDQKALTKFAYKHLLELPEDAAGVGLYTLHVIVEAFSTLLPRPKAVRRPAIECAWHLPADVLADKARDCEPYAAQYLHDALTEVDDVALTESEQAHCARVVHAAIVSLHEACESVPKA